MTRAKISIHNVNDAEAYIRAQLPRVILSPEMREELVQTGLLLLYEMENKYQPGKGGQDPLTSTFSGFVEGQHLGDKIRDQWHRLEGHKLASDGEGGRKWMYPKPQASLDQMQEREGGLDNIRELQGQDVYEADLAKSIARASDEQHEVDKDVDIKVGVLLGEEMPASVIAEVLGLRDKEVAEAVQRIIRYQPRLTTLEVA